MTGRGKALLRKAFALVETAQSEAENASERVRVGQLMASFERIDKPLASIAVPESVLVEMLHTGTNVWVAGVCGVNTEMIRDYRKRYGIPAKPVGGSIRNRQAAREAWLAEWMPKLQPYRKRDAG